MFWSSQSLTKIHYCYSSHVFYSTIKAASIYSCIFLLMFLAFQPFGPPKCPWSSYNRSRGSRFLGPDPEPPPLFRNNSSKQSIFERFRYRHLLHRRLHFSFANKQLKSVNGYSRRCCQIIHTFTICLSSWWNCSSACCGFIAIDKPHSSFEPLYPKVFRGTSKVDAVANVRPPASPKVRCWFLSEFCWQIALTFLQHLRLWRILVWFPNPLEAGKSDGDLV